MGWKERDIASAIASDGLELPGARTRGDTRCARCVSVLLTFAALYITVSSMIGLYFNYLDYLFFDGDGLEY